MTFENRYASWASRSRELFGQASEVIPGGAGSSARTAKFGWRPYPPFMAQGTGSRIRDVDGHEYVDYLLGLGPMILGHRHPVVTRAVADAITEYGTCFGLPYELEIEAARKVVDAVPGVELVRFTNSGSEAVGSAIRIARACTGRRLLIRFEGHYHGWQDTVYWSNHVDPAAAGPASRPRPVPSGPGVPAELAATLIVLTWNDAEGFAAVMAEYGDQVAAVITEPAVFNTGCILPEPGYLELLRELTARHGALLIFDEVITGFRFARGGAQEYFGVTPDLTTMAKGLGRRIPRRRHRRQPRGHVDHRRRPVLAFGHLQRQRGGLRGGERHDGPAGRARAVRAAARAGRAPDGRAALAGQRGRPAGRRRGPRDGVPDLVQRPPDQELARRARAMPGRICSPRWWQEMLLRGVLFHPSHYENLFVSLVHTDADIDAMLNAAADAFAVTSSAAQPAGLRS